MSRISRAAPPGADAAAEQKAAHVAEITARRDEMVAGCVSCTMPDEGDRGDFLADVALGGRSVEAKGRDRPSESSSSARRRGSESLMHRGTSHVPSSPLAGARETMTARAQPRPRAAADGAAATPPLPRLPTPPLANPATTPDADAGDARPSRGALRPAEHIGQRPGRQVPPDDVSDVKPYEGPFDAVVFNDSLASEHDPADALRRAACLVRPGSTVDSQRLTTTGKSTTWRCPPWTSPR